MRLDSNENWCLSGGADGADLAWGEAARHAGHGIIHFSFEGHRTAASHAELVLLSQAKLQAADPYCRRANIRLQRKFPPRSPLVRNLLRRDWYQVELSAACYAVSEIKKGQVTGGTAWAVSMFLDRSDNLPVYVFDQRACHWYHWSNDGWEPIYEPPMPSGIWTGIGSQELTSMGRLAINVLLDYWPNQKTIWN